MEIAEAAQASKTLKDTLFLFINFAPVASYLALPLVLYLAATFGAATASHSKITKSALPATQRKTQCGFLK